MQEVPVVEGLVVEGIYRHCAGGLYILLDVAMRQGENYVIYQDFSNQKVYVRTMVKFLEWVIYKGQKQRRFEFLIKPSDMTPIKC